jgi:hypothetical protein
MADRRVTIEKLREKAAVAIGKLEGELDADGHDPSCVLRCFETGDCFMDHHCRTCGGDEGTDDEEGTSET